MKKAIIFICALHCAQLSYSQKTLKRYKAIRRHECNTQNKLVDVQVMSSKLVQKKEEEKSKTIFDLSPRGQQAALQQRKTEELEKLLKADGTKSEEQAPEVISYATYNMSVTFHNQLKKSITGGRPNFWDRIEYLHYEFTMDDNPALDKVKFRKWNKYATQAGSIDLGTLEYSRTFTANLELNAGAEASYTNNKKSSDGDNTRERSSSLGPSVGGKGSTGYNSTSKTNQNIRTSNIEFGGYFTDKTFSVEQQSTFEKANIPNSSVEFMIELPTTPYTFHSFSKLFSAPYTALKPSQVKLSKTITEVPDLNTDITGTLKTDFFVRHIVKGSNSVTEFDDRISYIQGENEKKISLIKAKDFVIPVYFIMLDKDGQPSALSLHGRNTLQFKTLYEALKFKEWLLAIRQGLKGGALKISGQPILFDNGLQVGSPKIKDDHIIVSQSEVKTH